MNSSAVADRIGLGRVCVHVVDMGICNLRSIMNALARIGVRGCSVSEPAALGKGAHAVVLPGVGAFPAAMSILTTSGMDQRIKDLAHDGLPILGICLGMQLLFQGSDEYGANLGLGLLDGWVRRLEPKLENVKVPNVGWCEADWISRPTILGGEVLAGKADAYYFVHSYWCDCKNAADSVATVDMGFRMTAAVERQNVMGVQFHPEKSLDSGMSLLARFSKFAARHG